MLKQIFWLVMLPLLLLACDNEEIHERGNGTIITETRTVGDFSQIEVEGNYDIRLQQGSTPSVAIETDENLLTYIQTEVSGKTLKIRNLENVKGSDGINLVVTYPELRKLEIGGAANIKSRETIQAKKLDIEVKGAALVDLLLAVKDLELDLAGASSVTLAGKAEELAVEMSGAGNLDAYELQVEDASIQLSGIGGAQVYVTENLNASVSGVGGIRYKGNPRNLQREVSGVGSIEPADTGNENQP